MSSFKALMVHRDDDKTIRHEMTELRHGDLPGDGDVLVEVKYSTVNYKDGLCLSGKGGLVRNYPHIPGIDFAGEVVSSSDKRYQARRSCGANRMACWRNLVGRLCAICQGACRLAGAAGRWA